MGRWLVLSGGLIVWTIHFLGVYGIASVADVVEEADAPMALWGIAGLTLLCVVANVLIGATALRSVRASDDDLDRFIRVGGAGGAALSLVAVIWQALPILVAR